LALSKVILQHPLLCVGIVNEDKHDAAFVRLNSIDLSKCLEYKVISASTKAEYDKSLEGILEHQHSQSWSDLDIRPGWKLIVVEGSFEASSNRFVFDAIFAFHHALGDGSSGIVFHQSMLEALNRSKMPDSDGFTKHIVQIPDSIALPPPTEEQINFQVSWAFLAKEVWHVLLSKWSTFLGRGPWAGFPPSAQSIQAYRSRVKVFSISPEQLSIILHNCREQRSTLTGLLYGIITVALALRIPTARSFNTLTPYSLRHLLDPSRKEDMGMYVSSYEITYPLEHISSIIKSRHSSVQLRQHIWTIARSFRESIVVELSRLPRDNHIGLLTYVKNYHGIFRSQIGRPRELTFAVSNLGSCKCEGDEHGWRIEEMIFSQSGFGIGAAFSFNVVSVANGPLTISTTWLEGAVQEEVICEVSKYLEKEMASMR